MRKLKILFVLSFVITMFGLSSCVDTDYDNPNEDIYFSPEGISVPLGDLEPYYLTELTTETSIEYNEVLPYTIKDLFIGDTYDIFFEDNEGDLTLKFYIEAKIGDISSPNDFSVELTPIILNDRGANLGIDLLPGKPANQKYIKIENLKNNLIELTIQEADMLKMKSASDLKLDIRFKININSIDNDDCFHITDIGVSKTGGIYYNP